MDYLGKPFMSSIYKTVMGHIWVVLFRTIPVEAKTQEKIWERAESFKKIVVMFQK